MHEIHARKVGAQREAAGVGKSARIPVVMTMRSKLGAIDWRSGRIVSGTHQRTPTLRSSSAPPVMSSTTKRTSSGMMAPIFSKYARISALPLKGSW